MNLKLSQVIEVSKLMEQYEIKDLAEFIHAYAHHHIKSNEEMKLVAAIKADQAAMDKFEEESEIDSLFNSLVADLQPLIKEA